MPGQRLTAFSSSCESLASLGGHGVTHKLITIEGGGHVFDAQIKEKHEVAAAYDAVLAFLEEHVGAE